MKYIKLFDSYFQDITDEEKEKRLSSKEILHWTDYRGLYGILNGNEMFSSRDYISFTISKYFIYMLKPVRITFDFDCMKKLFEFEAFNFTNSNNFSHEKEVRIIDKKIHGIRECITKVEFFTTLYYPNYQDGIITILQEKYPNIEFIKMGSYYDDYLKTLPEEKFELKFEPKNSPYGD